jgi:predicted TIM-barrel fold metal-dependent hydrolase
MKLTRRNLLKQSAAAGIAALSYPAMTSDTEAQAAVAEASRKIRIGVSTYSYWHFDKVKYPIEKVIENASKLGFDGVEVLHRQMESEDKKYVNNLKKLAWELGLPIFFLSIHQSLFGNCSVGAACL